MSPLPGSSMGPLWREVPVSRAFLYITSRVPSKGALPPGTPHRAPSERETDATLLEPSFIHLSKSLVNEPTSRFPIGAHMDRDALIQSFLVHILQSPQ